MKIHMRFQCHTIVVLCYAVLSTADHEYINKATKVWNLPSASNEDDTAVVNVTSASIVIPSSYSNNPVARTAKLSRNFQPYAFRPRAVPVNKPEQPPHEKSIYYTQDNQYKTEILFPGNYFEIPKEKSVESPRGTSYNPLNSGSFKPQSIPLIRDQSFKKRSLDLGIEPIEDESEQTTEENSELTPSWRSLSYILGGGEEEEEVDDEDGEYEEEEVGDVEQKGSHGSHGNHIKKKLKKKLRKTSKKYSKYMLPLLLAYKLKFFALIPVMIGGLVLLVGATGLAGFFFALFAAVMGLQKGGY